AAAQPAPAPAPAAAAIPEPEGSRAITGTVEEFTEACRANLAQARDSATRMRALPKGTPPADVLALYDEVQSGLVRADGRAGVARNAHPDAAMRKAAEACEQDVDKLRTELNLDRAIYDALAAIDMRSQDPATQTWLDRTLKKLRRMGVDRDEATRAKVTALNEELVQLGQQFGKNIREDVRSVALKPAQLAGLPEDFVKAHPAGKDGLVRVTTDTPDYAPFLSYARDAKAREALWRVARLRGHPKNLDVLSQMLAKRHELATLLGFPSYAAYITEDKMVKTATAAAEFIEKVNAAAEGPAKREWAELLALKRRDVKGAKTLEPWDVDFYTDRLKAERFAFDSQAARPYLEYGRVLAGVLDVTSTLFGIRYQPVPNAKVWHPDVAAYDVFDGQERLGRIYLDMHPRADKYKHAAQFDLVSGQKGKRLPEGVLMCNFPRPGGPSPALMQPGEVETFFHEFGHLLHHILGGGQRWVAQSGVATEWDFVEAPSMMLQEWAVNAESLARFARHHETGAPIPADMIARMMAAKEFGKGIFTRRQMFLAAVSLNLHNRAPVADTTAFVKELQPKFEPFRKEWVDGTYFHTSFGHLDNYSAIYYTYIWSSVIARDLLTVFQSEGFLNPRPAARYRRAVLEAGGSKDAALLVKDFLGRDYGFDAYARWLEAPPPAPTPAAAK
ncbi:MAG TPA: M3 family metallopeptidase, partial [Longimicrobium sp.]|nr:M3 family metallopeptidase [Longimicrobium sp.]